VKEIRAFIPAAGLGERLRPITCTLPKPLLPLLGKPVIETIVERCSRVSISRIGINMHHRWEMLRDWAEASPYSGKITLFHEETILGTGGALKNARHFLEDSLFLVHNADIVSDIDLKALVAGHLKSGNIATLAVHEHEKFNSVWIDREGHLHSIGKEKPRINKELRPVAFTGIALYSPDFLRFLPEGPSSVVDAWLMAASSGERVGTIDFTGSRWSDIGTPDSYASIVFDALKAEGEALYIDPSTACGEIRAASVSVIERNCSVGRGAELHNCILLPGARIDAGAVIRKSIVGPDYIVPLLNSPQPPASVPIHVIAAFLHNSSQFEVYLIGTGGSDRIYYRLNQGSSSLVMMQCQKDDPDLERHLLYTTFFRKYSVPVPELLSADEDHGNKAAAVEGDSAYAFFEDLGDVSLYTWLKFRKNHEQIETLYRHVLEMLSHLHYHVSRNVSECPLLASRLFDRDHLRWETDYFCERFVKGLLGIRLQHESELGSELEALARRVDSFGKTIVHRDFQSQNIMVTEGDIPRIIDYQGARMGPPAYDLASLLWDPYAALDDETRKRLIEHYILVSKGHARASFDEEAFIQTVLPCRLQRHMQALGAYAFLSTEKGKSHFRKHIPPALRYLSEEASEVRKDYPALYDLLLTINEKAGY
jgi:NDP-sugar pyrophosphorylase family protein/aminoglycoside/choline kinase family phosphotransferase